MSIIQLHRESTVLLRAELERIGFRFPLGSGSLDMLYPHLVGHPVGIGASLSLCISQIAGTNSRPTNDCRPPRVESIG